jgi:hypothetical protein
MNSYQMCARLNSSKVATGTVKKELKEYHNDGAQSKQNDKTGSGWNRLRIVSNGKLWR